VVIESVEEDGDVPPRQFCNSLLQNLLVRPRGRERAHVGEVPRGEALHLRELSTQIRREPADDVAPPPLVTLALQDRRADSPVETDEFRVHAALRCESGRAHLLLQLSKGSGIPGYGWRRIRHHCPVCPTRRLEEE
jgi:hypothetical protein